LNHIMITSHKWSYLSHQNYSLRYVGQDQI
jgi:hypothetical protein